MALDGERRARPTSRAQLVGHRVDDPEASRALAGVEGAMRRVEARARDIEDKIDTDIAAASVGVVGGVYNVLDHGLVANGLFDNRIVLQELVDKVALAGGGMIYFPPGVYIIRRRPGTGPSNLGDIRLVGSQYKSIHFTGAGKASKIIMEGNNEGDWYQFLVGNRSSHIYFSHLYFAQGVALPLNEQMHTIQIQGNPNYGAGPGPTDVHVFECYFGHVNGDSVHLLGPGDDNEDLFVRRVRVDACVFYGREHYNDPGNTIGTRSAVGVFSGIVDTRITNNYMTGSDDQLIDYEPGGTGGNDDDLIDGNIVEHDLQGATAITLSGNSVDFKHRQFLLTNNIVINARVNGLNIEKCHIARNIVLCDSFTSSDAALGFLRGAIDAHVIDNVVIVPAGSGAAVITFNGDSLGIGERVTIAGNTVIWQNLNSGIQLENVKEANVHDNRLIWLGAVAGANQAAISWQPTLAGCGRALQIHHNQILNQGSATLRESINIDSPPSGGQSGEVVVMGNVCRGNFTNGISVRGTTYANPPVVIGNQCSGSTNGVLLDTGVTIIIGGNGFDRAIYSRVGTPEGAVTAPVGAQCLRRDGGAATTLYIKESGTGNTGWVAK